jgi:orotate phosphoribosyltransferase
MRSNVSLSGLTIYLVDDIATSGNTLRDAARAVREAGAISVIGIAAGRDADIASLAFADVIEKVKASDADFYDQTGQAE